MSKIQSKIAKAAKSKKTPIAKKAEEVTETDTEAAAKVTPKKEAPAPVGHNNPPADETDPNVGGFAAKQLKQFIKAVEDIDEEQKSLQEEKKDIFAHAKETGFDVKTMRKVIALRKRPKSERDADQELIDTYMHALGDR